jgi:hypothetical protein
MLKYPMKILSVLEYFSGFDFETVSLHGMSLIRAYVADR